LGVALPHEMMGCLYVPIVYIAKNSFKAKNAYIQKERNNGSWVCASSSDTIKVPLEMKVFPKEMKDTSM